MQILNKEITMIALDIDGTTLNSKKELTERTRKALENAIAKGVHVVFSTGRSYNSLSEAIKSLNGVSYVITSNGAHINEFSTGKAIYNDYVYPANVEKVIELVEKYDIGIEVFIDGQAYIDAETYHDIEKNGCEYRNAEYVLWSREPVEDIKKLMLENRNTIENVNFCFDNEEKYNKAKPEICAIEKASITASFRNSLELGGENTSKRTALIELMKMLNVEKDQLMCCGDASNDIPMIELAGIGVAMGNAWDEVKEKADFVTESCDDDGVGIAVEKFVLNM